MTTYLRTLGNEPVLNRFTIQFWEKVNRNGVFDVSINDCKGPHNARLCEEGWNAVKAFCTWLKKDAPQRRIAALRPRAATRKEWIGLPESLEMQNTIAALGRLRRKSMRFDVLPDKALSLGGLLP